MHRLPLGFGGFFAIRGRLAAGDEGMGGWGTGGGRFPLPRFASVQVLSAPLRVPSFLLRCVQKKKRRKKIKKKSKGFSKPEQAFPLREEAAIQKRAGSSVSWLSSSGVLLCLEQFLFFKKLNYKADALTD